MLTTSCTLVMVYLWISGSVNCNTVNDPDPAASALVIGSKTQYNRVYQMKYYVGEPSVWAATAEDRERIRMKNLGKNNKIDIYSRIACHYSMNSMVWFNKGGKEIEFGKILLDSSSYTTYVQDVFNFTSAKGGGITVDWVSNNIYWTDQAYQWILMAPMKENPDFHIVLTQGLDIPGDIIVHPGKSLLFWTDLGKKPRIERSDLLGGNREVIVDDNLGKPVGLEIDYTSNRLYWIDSEKSNVKGSIESCGLDGESRQVLLEDEFLLNVVGIALYKDYMFAADDKLGRIRIIPLSSPENHKYVRPNGVNMYDITVFSGVKQPNMESPCQSSGCSGMCVGKEENTKSQCICPWGQQLQEDGKTCTVSDYITPPIYAYIHANPFYQIHKLCWYPVWAPDTPESELQSTCEHTLRGSDFVLGSLVNKRYLYIGTGTSIKRLVMKIGATMENWVEDTGTIKAISSDWLTNTVYWTSEGLIKSVDMDGKNIQTVVSSVTGVNGLVVEPFSKQIFWTTTKPTIEKASLDGSSRSTVLSNGMVTPQHLAIDYEENRLYWTDSSKGTIESVNIDGSPYRKAVISKAGSKPFGISIFQGYVAYTDRNDQLDTPSVKWAYKDGSGLVSSHVHDMRSELGSIILYGPQSQPQSLYIKLNSSSNLTLILLIVLAVIIVILVVTLIIGFLLYKRNARERSSPKHSGTNSPQGYDASYSKVSAVSGNTENREIAC